MRKRVLAVLASLALAAPVVASDTKLKKPVLSVRATPRFAFSPVNVRFTAELTGGDDVEEYYCPELIWEWGDGGKSVHEPDCEPFEAGTTRIERRFSAVHEFRTAATYNVKVSLQRTGRPFAVQSVRVTVRPGPTDNTDAPEN